MCGGLGKPQSIHVLLMQEGPVRDRFDAYVPSSAGVSVRHAVGYGETRCSFLFVEGVCSKSARCPLVKRCVQHLDDAISELATPV